MPAVRKPSKSPRRGASATRRRAHNPSAFDDAVALIAARELAAERAQERARERAALRFGLKLVEAMVDVAKRHR